MSAGGTFKLTANDGKADRMIMASSLLRQRINDVVMSRKAAGKSDLTPTLIDIERTHILFVNAHFKPFAAMAYEYNKVRPQSGEPVFGGGVTFSLPQYGDFFYDIVVRTRIDNFQSKAGTLPTPTTPNAIYDVFGNQLSTGSYNNLVRYCEYPGHRLFTKVSFEVNGNPLDSYDTDIVLTLEKFTTCVNKVAGNDRLVGQQVPLQAYGDLTIANVYDNDVSTNNYNTPINIITPFSSTQSNQQPALFGVTTSATGTLTSYPSPFIPSDLETEFGYLKEDATGKVTDIGTSDSEVTNIKLDPTNTSAYAASVIAYGSGRGNAPYQYNINQQLTTVVNGPQTPKPIQPPLEIWNKLRFWFNENVNLAIASVSIPFGQRFINIDICNQEQLLLEHPSLVTYIPNNIETTTPFAFLPYYTKNGIDPVDLTMEMYINNIFLNPEIHDIYIRRIGFSLIRVYRKQLVQVTSSTGEILLSQLKWPVEYLMVGFRPRFNTLLPSPGSSGAPGSGNWEYWHDWHRFTRQLTSFTPTIPVMGLCYQWDGVDTNDVAVTFGTQASMQSGNLKYYLPVSSIDTLSLVSHGINIYDRFSDRFFNQYMPYNYGGINLNTPTDEGAFFLNMCLFPRAYQPSGHLNISRARETYLNYTSTYISASTPCDAIIVAVAINFLLITDGSAILRYST